jgi:thiol-disulfide isomerase/thioredoxin
MRRVPLISLFAVALVAAGCGDQSSAPVPPPALSPVTARDLLKKVQDARGNVVLVNVWATWCDPCRHEFPALLRVRRELAGRQFRLILVSADFADQQSKVLQFLAQQGVGFATFLKAEEDMPFINTLDSRWSGALPATFLFDGAGKLRDFWEGEASYENLAGKVKALLGSLPERGVEGGSR